MPTTKAILLRYLLYVIFGMAVIMSLPGAR